MKPTSHFIPRLAVYPCNEQRYRKRNFLIQPQKYLRRNNNKQVIKTYLPIRPVRVQYELNEAPRLANINMCPYLAGTQAP